MHDRRQFLVAVPERFGPALDGEPLRWPRLKRNATWLRAPLRRRASLGVSISFARGKARVPSWCDGEHRHDIAALLSHRRGIRLRSRIEARYLFRLGHSSALPRRTVTIRSCQRQRTGARQPSNSTPKRCSSANNSLKRRESCAAPERFGRRRSRNGAPNISRSTFEALSSTSGRCVQLTRVRPRLCRRGPRSERGSHRLSELSTTAPARRRCRTSRRPSSTASRPRTVATNCSRHRDMELRTRRRR